MLSGNAQDLQVGVQRRSRWLRCWNANKSSEPPGDLIPGWARFDERRLR